MKKLLALLLVLVVCVGTLASCTVPSFLQPAVDFVNGILGNEPDDTTAVSIDDAATYLYNMYKDDEGKKTPNDFDVVAKVVIDGVSFDVTWTSDNEKVVIKESTKANFYTVDIPDANAEEFSYKLTATIKSGDETVTKTFTRVVPVVDNSGIATQPEENVAYKLFFYQGNKQKTYYALTTIVSDKFIDTTEDPTAAPDFYVETEGDGVKIYTTINGAKKYLEAYLVEDGQTAEGVTKWSKRLRFSDVATVWTYKADCNAWFTTIQDGPYVIGTYNTYTTISISEGSFMSASTTGVSQFPLQFILSDYAEANGKVEGPVEHTCADANGDYACDTENCDKVLAPAANSTLTLEQATKLATALKGDYSTDKYFIVVTIDEVYNAQYGNLYVSDATVDKFTVYGTYDATGANRYDAMGDAAPVAGDTVTIWGVIGSHNGTAQMKNGWFTDEAPETPDTPDTPATGDGIIFDLGANGDAAWADGNEVTEETLTFTSGNYTLTITNMTKVYSGAFDGKGNSILKLGTSSTAASFTFVVPADVNSVIIYAGAYKTYADNATISVNGTQYTLTGMAGNGEYDAITVDTSSNKTVTLETVAAGKAPRAAINTIVFSTTAGGSSTPDTPDEPETPDEPSTSGKTYTLATALQNGDKVVIVAPSHNKALSMVKIATYYNVGIDVSANFNAITDDEIFVVGIDADGNYTFTSVSGKKLALAASYSSLNHTEEGINTTWTLEAKEGASGVFYLKNVARGNYLEWYAEKNNWSSLATTELSDLFEISFYVVSETTAEPEQPAPETPVDPEPTPDPEPEAHEHTFATEYSKDAENHWFAATCEHTSEVKDLAAHSYTNGVCVCGQTEPVIEPEQPDQPVDGIVLTTIPEALAIAEAAGTAYTTEKYYITGTVFNVYNTQYGNFYLKDEAGNEICIYGLYTMDGETRYDAMTYKPVEGDKVTVYTILGMYNTTKQGKNAGLYEVVPHEHNYTENVVAPGCVTEGYTTHTCTICKTSYTDNKVAATGHTTDNGECGNCGLTIGGDAPAIGTLAEFTFGENGSAAHKDPSSKFSNGKSYTVNGYDLTFTSATNCYDGGNDAKGNSCMKMGTSSNAGSFTVTVADNVTEVVIYVAQYKANTTKISVNGGAAQTISTASNNGEYTAITIDTSTNKTFTFATVSGGVRCMIDAIVFNGIVG